MTKATVKKENAITRYFRETRAELRKVNWPTRQQVLNLTLIVVAFTILMAAILGITDYFFAWLFALIIR